MNLDTVFKTEHLTYQITHAARKLEPSAAMLHRLEALENIVAEARVFAETFDSARLQKPECANRLRDEAVARWTAFITGGQGT